MRGNTLRSVPMRVLPSEADLLNIPLATVAEYELSDKEVKSTRSRIYALNKENASFRWRTMREFPFLVIWRMRKR